MLRLFRRSYCGKCEGVRQGCRLHTQHGYCQGALRSSFEFHRWRVAGSSGVPPPEPCRPIQRIMQSKPWPLWTSPGQQFVHAYPEHHFGRVRQAYPRGILNRGDQEHRSVAGAEVKSEPFGQNGSWSDVRAERLRRNESWSEAGAGLVRM